MIEVKIDELLEKHGRSFYWLAKQTGISHTTLWRLKKGKSVGINFPTLEKICEALECQPGDILILDGEKNKGKKESLTFEEQRIHIRRSLKFPATNCDKWSYYLYLLV